MDENRVIFRFTEWLDEHDLSYDVIKSPKDEPRLYITFQDGWYIRISEFDNGLQWYVRDNGEVYWASVFEIVERILKQKAESDIQKAWLKGDMKAVGDILDKNLGEEREKKMELTSKQVLASMSRLPIDTPESEHIRKIIFG